jgi:ribonuclease inhibitor
MKTCIIDGAQITDRRELHRILAEKLDFPEWYGNNLDALYDCLTDEREEVQIAILHGEELKKRLGTYAQRFLTVLERASEENSKIHSVFR